MRSPRAETGGIAFILLAAISITGNDLIIKLLSDSYPLHQMVFARSIIAVLASLVFLRLEGGWSLLRTERPVLHAVRATLVVVANLTYFAALAVMPLGAATALFFVAPLFITLLAIPVLNEPVGAPRLVAIVVGFLGVVVMMGPGVDWGGISRWTLLLPVAAAGCYAGMQVLTRKLGAQSAASAMAIYIQGTFVLVGLAFFVSVGDGRYVGNVDHPTLVFLLRAWTWPQAGDWWAFVVLGLLSAVIGYSLSQAYRLGSASVIASFEYAALPLAIFWGWLVFDEVPRPVVWLGVVLIAGAGLLVFARERALERSVASGRPIRRA